MKMLMLWTGARNAKALFWLLTVPAILIAPFVLTAFGVYQDLPRAFGSHIMMSSVTFALALRAQDEAPPGRGSAAQTLILYGFLTAMYIGLAGFVASQISGLLSIPVFLAAVYMLSQLMKHSRQYPAQPPGPANTSRTEEP